MSQPVASTQSDGGQDSVSIIPDWEVTLGWMCENAAQHGFIRDAYGVYASILEITRYMYLSDPDALNRVIDALREKDKRR